MRCGVTTQLLAASRRLATADTVSRIAIRVGGCVNKNNLTATLVLFASVVGFAPTAVSPVEAAATVPPVPPVESWAWCGVHPDDPIAVVTATAMAEAGGIDATFGPCYDGPIGYSAAEPGTRYDLPAVYRRLVDINAAAGMKTIVYDKDLWSTNLATRTAAIDYWMPVISHIAAWDMGDEFNPNSGAQDTPPFQWNILRARWAIMNNDVLVRTGVRPFTNHFYFATDKALADLPGTDQLLSFTKYDGDLGASIARRHDAAVKKLMCGVNAYDHGSFRPTAKKIRDDMAALVLAGCDQFLVFGGQMVYKSTSFGDFSLVDKFGVATDRAAAAKEGSGQSSYTPVVPARLLESRVGPGLSTIDGQFNGGGTRPERSVTDVVEHRVDRDAAIIAVGVDQSFEQLLDVGDRWRDAVTRGCVLRPRRRRPRPRPHSSCEPYRRSIETRPRRGHCRATDLQQAPDSRRSHRQPRG